MEDAMLILTVVAIIWFGFFLIMRLDRFLTANHAAIQREDGGRENTLRIAFSDPSVAGAVTEALERFSKLHPDIGIRMFSGDTDGITRQLASGEIDVALLPGITASNAFPMCGKMLVMLRQENVKSEACNLSIAPLAPLENAFVAQCIIWKKTACNGTADALIMQFQKNLQAYGGSAVENML